jgi:hypothetical protein
MFLSQPELDQKDSDKQAAFFAPFQDDLPAIMAFLKTVSNMDCKPLLELTTLRMYNTFLLRKYTYTIH